MEICDEIFKSSKFHLNVTLIVGMSCTKASPSAKVIVRSTVEFSNYLLMSNSLKGMTSSS